MAEESKAALLQSFLDAHVDGNTNPELWGELCEWLGLTGAAAHFHDYNHHTTSARDWTDDIESLLERLHIVVANVEPLGKIDLRAKLEGIGILVDESAEVPSALAAATIAAADSVRLSCSWLRPQCAADIGHDARRPLHNMLRQLVPDRPRLDASSCTSIVSQLLGAGITVRPDGDRCYAAPMMEPPKLWKEADKAVVKQAYDIFSDHTYEGVRDPIVSLVGGPGTGKSYALNQILSQQALMRQWGESAASVGITFNDHMNLIADESVNVWREVVLRLLYSHFSTRTDSFVVFRDKLAQHVTLQYCDAATVNATLDCILKDVDSQGCTRLVVAVDELIAVDRNEIPRSPEGQPWSVMLLSLLSTFMDSWNAKHQRSVLLVVSSLHARPLDSVKPSTTSSGRRVITCKLPSLVARKGCLAAGEYVLGAAASKQHRHLLERVVALAGGHPRTLECTCEALRTTLRGVGKFLPEQHVLPAVLEAAATSLSAKYNRIGAMTLAMLCDAWTGALVAGTDTYVDRDSKKQSVGDYVAQGTLFAKVQQGDGDTLKYRLWLSCVHLFVWARKGSDTLAGCVSNLIVAANGMGYDKDLEVAVVNSLRLRMILLANPDTKKVVTWRQLLAQDGAGLTEPALDCLITLPCRTDQLLRLAALKYTPDELANNSTWLAEGVKSRVCSLRRQGVWLHPPPAQVAHYDLIMGYLDGNEKNSVGVVQVKGAATVASFKTSWIKAHKKKVKSAVNGCQEHVDVFVAAMSMEIAASQRLEKRDTFAKNPKKPRKTPHVPLSEAGLEKLIHLDWDACRRLIGPLLFLRQAPAVQGAEEAKGDE